jgi:hypothetical protein
VEPAVDAVNDYKRLMYQLPLNRIAFEQDNETVFSFIQLAVVHSQAETWIYDHVHGRGGRGAMKALRNHYEDEAELDVQALKAQQILDTLVYTNKKQMTFEAMITISSQANNVRYKGFTTISHRYPTYLLQLLLPRGVTLLPVKVISL